MTDRELMQMALDAIEAALSDDQPYISRSKETVEALRSRLAQPEQEEDYDAIANKQLASLKAAAKVTFEDAVVRAVHKLYNAPPQQPEQDEREKVAQWMIQRSYATGHGDTTEDLLAELEWQVREAERNNMVATAAELGWALYGGDPFEDGVRDVAAIRARREQ